MEASETEGNFVETGYIYSVHGLQGEVRVKATTDFPELRFSEVKTIRNLIVGLNSCCWHAFLYPLCELTINSARKAMVEAAILRERDGSRN